MLFIQVAVGKNIQKISFFGVVLPSIRRTGSSSLQQSKPDTTEEIAWQNKRLEGKALMKLKNASWQHLIGGGFGQAGIKL